MQGTYQQWSQRESRIKWGAIFASLAVGIAAQMVFTLLPPTWQSRSDCRRAKAATLSEQPICGNIPPSASFLVRSFTTNVVRS